MADRALTVSEIANMVGGRVIGNGNVPVISIAPLDTAGPDHISFAASPKFKKKALSSRAGALILPEGWPRREQEALERPLVLVKNPHLAYAKIAQHFFSEEPACKGIHPSVVMGDRCKIGEDVTLGANVVVGNGVSIGNRVFIHPGVVIGDGVEIGDDTKIYPNVTIYGGCRIGSRVIIHSGVVIGADGFGFATDEQGQHWKIPQVGIVIIEDDVEIGANTTIDRAAFGATRICRGVMIDNLVMIAHNVEVGPGSIIVAQSGIAGSTKLGRGVVVAAQAGLIGHIEIGDRAVITAKSGVVSSVPAGEAVSGVPAIPHTQFLRLAGALKKLPDLVSQVRNLKKEIAKLKAGKREE